MRSLRALLVIAPILLVIGLFLSASTAARANAHPTTPLGLSILGFSVAAVVAVGPAVLLILSARRAKRRAGIVTGAVLAGIGVLFCGIPLTNTVTLASLTVLANLGPATEEESRYSMFELGVLGADFLVDSTDGLAESAPPASTTAAPACELSSLRGGTRATGERHVPTSATQQQALDTVAATWREAGYEVSEHSTFISAEGTGWLDEAHAFWENGALDVTFASICVASS